MSDKLYSNQSPLPSDLYIKKGGKVFTGDFYRVRNGVPPILQEKTATENGSVLPDGGYEGLSQVTVDVQPVLQEKSVTENGEVTADEGYDGLSKVMVDVQGGASFNIHYGTEPPTDTSKLWVETDIVPIETKITGDIKGEYAIETGVSALPREAAEIISATVGTKIYLFGGKLDSKGGSFLTSINAYDAETNTVTPLNVYLPASRSNTTAAAAVGKKIYLFGGYKYESYSSRYFNDILEFDTETNTIKTLSTTFADSIYNAKAATVGTKIYIFGGSNYTNRVHIFDTITNNLTLLTAKLPYTISGHAAVAVGKKVFLFGGNSSGTIQIFDTTTNTAETISTTLTVAQTGMSAEMVGDKIYLLGGSSSSAIQVFDPTTYALEVLPITLPQAQYNMGSGAVGTKIYTFGGYYVRDINALAVKADLAENTVAILPSMTDNVFPIMDVVKLGVSKVFIGNADGKAEQANAYVHKWFENTTKFYKYSCKQSTAGTELESSVTCAVGDLVIACIVTRDTLTLSEGWTLISTSDINSSDTSGNGQRLSFAYKYAESTTESITVTQASEQRLLINLVALSGATGFIDNGYHYDNNENSNTSSITVDKPSGLVLWACAAPMWNSSGYPVWEVSNNAPILQLGSSTQSRLCTVLDQTDDASVTFKAGTTNSTIIVGSLTIEGMDEYIHTDSGYVWELI